MMTKKLATKATTKAKSTARPRKNSEDTKAALVSALLRLLADRSVGDVSVRDVAAEAGVNHGLVHRYFGSKEALVREAVARISAHVHAEPPASATGAKPSRGTAWSYDVLRANPTLALVVARACLDGPRDLLPLAAPPPERLEAIIAPIRRALERLGLADKIDPYLLNALGTSALLGWFVFRPLLAHGYGLPADADERLAALVRLIDAHGQ